MNLETFKKNAQRAGEFLQQQGIEVPHATLLEALARYEGHRSYRALRASSTQPEKAPACPVLLSPSESIWLIAKNHGDGSFEVPSGRPSATAFRVTQSAYEELRRASQVSVDTNADLDGEFIARAYLGNEWRFGYTEVTVGRGFFYAQGVEEYSDCATECDSIQLAALELAVAAARKEGAEVIFWGMSESDAKALIEEIVDCDEGGQTTDPLRETISDGMLSKALYWETTYVSTQPA